MKTFEERKAEIFCRAQKQKEKEKKARKRACGIGVVTAFCLCIAVGAVLHMPELSEDMIADADSKGNASATDVSENNLGIENAVCSEEELCEESFSSAEDEDMNDAPVCETFSESESRDETDNEICTSEDADSFSAPFETFSSEEATSEEFAPEDVAPEWETPLGPTEDGNSQVKAAFSLLGITAISEDCLYGDFGDVLVVECNVLYTMSAEKDERIKLVLPLSYAERIEKGDSLVALLSNDGAHTTLLYDGAVYILGKSTEMFDELTVLNGFSAEMTEDEALSFFENFSE